MAGCWEAGWAAHWWAREEAATENVEKREREEEMEKEEEEKWLGEMETVVTATALLLLIWAFWRTAAAAAAWSRPTSNQRTSKQRTADHWMKTSYQWRTTSDHRMWKRQASWNPWNSCRLKTMVSGRH